MRPLLARLQAIMKSLWWRFAGVTPFSLILPAPIVTVVAPTPVIFTMLANVAW